MNLKCSIISRIGGGQIDLTMGWGQKHMVWINLSHLHRPSPVEEYILEAVKWVLPKIQEVVFGWWMHVDRL